MADRAGAKSWWLRASVMAGCALGAIAVGGGCSSTPSPATAYIDTSVLDPVGGSGCNYPGTTEQFFLYGMGDAGASTGFKGPPIQDGETVAAGPASVSCSVTQSGTGFMVSASIKTTAGNFSIASTTPWPSTKTAMPTGVNISFGYANNAYASETAMPCTVTYTTDTSDPIALGRVWGTFNCPLMNATSGGQFVCQGTGTFQLTNCAD